jgi:methylated-DNA-[protein]-cysteine S-methyltransferase
VDPDETIYYESPIGPLRLAASQGALSCLQFVKTEKYEGNDQDIIFSSPATGTLREAVRQLDEYFAGRNLHFQLPVKQPGTAFQQRVWEELIKIKAGTTLSYLQLSKQIGDIKAIRAVGTANGKNNIAIVVPCHRVIGSNGSLVGYAGDLWRKQWLLNHEDRYCNGVQSLF